MFAMSSRRLLTVFIIWLTFAGLLALATFSSPASADHNWNNYHWGRTGNPFTVQLDDNLSSAWKPYLATASKSVENNDWNESAELETSIKSSTNTKRCNATSGIVEVCSATYGKNGWLGLASVWVSGGHIVQGTAKMNDTYFNTSRYNTPGWKHLVMCQEVGHTFGLGHVNESYDTKNEGTCMDYTDDPDGGSGGVAPDDPSNEYPNAHDHGMLTELYGHLDKTSTVGTTSAASRMPPAARAIDPSDPRQRGRLIHRSSGRGVEIYERDFGQGHKVITRLIRATDGTPTLESLEKTNGGKHDHDDHEH